MEFPGFWGNEQLKANLSAAVDRRRTAHFYLISGPRGSGKRTLARLLAAALLCRDAHSRPCGRCSQCRKVLNGSHPDLITVDDRRQDRPRGDRPTGAGGLIHPAQ